MTDAPITTRPMRPSDVPAVVGLLDGALGPAPAGVDRRALFEWKHLRNPFGSSIALVAEMDGAVVGLRSFMRWRLAGGAGDRAVSAVRAVDTATAPAVQRRGIFRRLTMEGMERCEEEKIALVFNTPNARSRPGYLSMGWQVVARWPLSVRVRRPHRLAMAAPRKDLRSGPAVPPPAGSALVPAATFLGGDQRGPRSEDPGGLHTARSIEYLRWRYADGPIAYHALEAGGASAIVRLHRRGPLVEAVVCEVFGPDDGGLALAEVLRRIPGEAGADHAIAHVGSGWPARPVLRRSFYLPVPRARIAFTVRSFRHLQPDPLEPGSWSLTLGDLELF